MFWVVVIIGGLILISTISGAGKKVEEAQRMAQKEVEFHDRLKIKADAYQDYLRRTSDSSDIKAMTDNELQEYIQENIRNFNNEMDGSLTLWGVLIFLGIISAMIFGLVFKSWGVFGLLLVSGVQGGFFLSILVGGNTEKKFRDKGLDIERLKMGS